MVEYSRTVLISVTVVGGRRKVLVRVAGTLQGIVEVAGGMVVKRVVRVVEVIAFGGLV